MLKTLSIEDRELVVPLLLPKEVDYFKNTFLSNLTHWRAFGWFENDELVGISTTYHDPSTSEWFLLKQHADKGEHMEVMVPAVCDKFESYGLYRFFWLDTDHSVDFMKNYIPDRYQHYTEFTMAAFGFPKNLLQWNIFMNNNFIAAATRIWLSVLPDQFRKL